MQPLDHIGYTARLLIGLTSFRANFRTDLTTVVPTAHRRGTHAIRVSMILVPSIVQAVAGERQGSRVFVTNSAAIVAHATRRTCEPRGTGEDGGSDNQ